MAAPLRIRAQAAFIRFLYALPQPVRRWMAGPPVRIDGQQLAFDAQLITRLKNLAGTEVFADPVDKSRTRYEELALITGAKPGEPIAVREVIIPAEHDNIPATLYTPAGLPEPSGLLAPGTDLIDPRLSPLHGDVTGLPPAYIATAGFDPLRDEGETYADKLVAGRIPVALSRQADLPHGYLTMVGIGHRFTEAAAEAAGALRLGLASAWPRPGDEIAGRHPALNGAV